MRTSEDFAGNSKRPAAENDNCFAVVMTEWRVRLLCGREDSNLYGLPHMVLNHARLPAATECPGEDSNLYALRHEVLNLACLPIPPPGQMCVRQAGMPISPRPLGPI